MKSLVLFDSRHREAWRCAQLVQPYLDHFGVAYTAVDLAAAEAPVSREDCPLVIVSHPGVPCSDLVTRALKDGIGVVSFDARDMGLLPHKGVSRPPADTHILHYTNNTHWIAARHECGEERSLVGTMELPGDAVDPACVLIEGHERPLLAAGGCGAGRLVVWSSSEWMLSGVRGPLGGRDDSLWRSLVWAAAKPCVMRPLEPLITRRVDDVAGWGGLVGRSPMCWVETCNRFGLKPWLGLFVYNLTPEALMQLKALEKQGQCSSFPHAFGRPVRSADQSHYYFAGGMGPRSKDYDEFIYFDHHNRAPWSDTEARRGLAAVDEWYAGPGAGLGKSYACCHWYEHASNTLPHVRNEWGVEYVCTPKATDIPYAPEHPWLRSGPYRLYEEPGACAFDVARRGVRPAYYADFVEIAGCRFFNCLTEIRDDAGYEWAPDRDVAATVGRGTRQLKRALDSFALASLFTHETDFIYKIPPSEWEQELARITKNVESYGARYCTIDEALPIVRAHRTSRLESYAVAGDGTVTVALRGTADVATTVTVYRDAGSDITERRALVPPFAVDAEVHV